MYIKTKNTVIVYPYNINLLYAEHPNTSFPNTIETDFESLKQFGVYKVTGTSKPAFDSLTQKCLEILPELVNDVWTQQWQVEPLTDQEKQTLYDSKAAEVRAERNRLLTETDWTQFKDIDPKISEKYAPYRQELRNVTAQVNFPWEVVWPELPQ